MLFLDSNLSYNVSDYLGKNLNKNMTSKEANQHLYNEFGIIDFFSNKDELISLMNVVSEAPDIVAENDRVEYGDFQTNIDLSNKVTKFLSLKKISPEIIVEPTCGKGNFIIASLNIFENVKKIIGIEIYKPYVWECKFNIIDFYLKKTPSHKPDITIIHTSVFDFDFNRINADNLLNEILVIGNPPWVTNSKLSSLNSRNLPIKTNFKKHNGIDAITGKGNFDIAEYITLMMIKTFQNLNGNIALLVKNSVVKNIIFDQLKNKYQISEIEKYNIDSKKEFNVSVDASLFFCKLKSKPEFECDEFDFYSNSSKKKSFGWTNKKFVSNLDDYSHCKDIDGVCPFEWRQGIKHDCASIMELEKTNDGKYVNSLNEEIYLESDLVYGIFKSSDLKNTVIREPRKYTIVTQKKVGQETSYIRHNYPETYKYLDHHKELFNQRKSSIYKGKPLFSIFGVGDYTFKPYKIAISGLYKTFHFTLILPENNKPILVDDTCYMIGFDKIEFAVYTLILLNSNITKNFLESITFSDAKRTFTKEVLMRIDLFKILEHTDYEQIKDEINNLNTKYGLNLSLNLWNDFISEFTPKQKLQMKLF